MLRSLYVRSLDVRSLDVRSFYARPLGWRSLYLRSLYLATLSLLQVALIVELLPPLAMAIRAHALAGLAPEGWPALLQLFAMGLAVTGSAVALVFPGMALARHRRAGAMRFLGLPRWAIAIAVIGIAVLLSATIAVAVASVLPADTRVSVLLIGRPAQGGGLALATAGVLCGELLRRSVPVPRARHALRHATGRVEVTHPPELRTHALPSTAPSTAPSTSPHMQGRCG